MQHAKLLAQHPAGDQQRLGDRRQIRMSATSSKIRASNLAVPTTPTLRPKLRSVPRRSLAAAEWIAHQITDAFPWNEAPD
jgi:hypothetical protein